MSISTALTFVVALPVVAIWAGWGLAGALAAFVVGLVIAAVGLTWRRWAGTPRHTRPRGVSDRIWNGTQNGLLAFVDIQYKNDRQGAQTVEHDIEELALLGYSPVATASTASHLNAGRTAVNAAAAFGMAKVLGIGVLRTSRSPALVTVRFAKSG